MTRYATIRADDYVFMTRFTETEGATRYYLAGVFIDRVGRLVATDGHRLGMLCLSKERGEVTKEAPENLILPVKKELIRACKDKGDQNFRRYLVLCSDTVRLAEYGTDST